MSIDKKKKTDKTIGQQPIVIGMKNILSCYWMPGLAAMVFLASQWQLMSYWSSMWDTRDSYYSHGPLVPILACIMVWMNKDRLSAIRPVGSWSGLMLMLLAIPLYVFGRLSSQMPASVPAFFLLLFGTLLCLFGKEITRILVWPVLFLLLMIPMPAWLLDSLTGRFQTVSTVLAANILQVAGLDILRQGNIITSSRLPQDLVIGVPCSGLKLIIAIIMCSSFLCYSIQGKLWKKGILFAAGLVLAVLINGIRIVMIGAVGVITGSSDSMVAFHDFSGYISLALCAVALLGIARLMGMRQFQEFAPRISALSKSAVNNAKMVFAVRTVAIVILLSLSVGAEVSTPLYDLPKGHIQEGSVPGSFGRWTATDIPIDKKTREILNKGDLLNRQYTNCVSGRSVQVFVDAAIHQSAFHYPHSCLPSSGNTIKEERIITLDLNEPVKATFIRTSNEYGTGLVMIYWYQWGDEAYARTEQMRAASVKNSLWYFRTAMQHPFGIQYLQNDIQSRQIVWHRFSTESMDESSDEQFLRSFVGEFVARNRNTTDGRRSL